MRHFPLTFLTFHRAGLLGMGSTLPSTGFERSHSMPGRLRTRGRKRRRSVPVERFWFPGLCGMGPYYSWQELGPGSRPQLHAHYRINHVALWVLGPNFGVSPKPGTLLLLSSGVGDSWSVVRQIRISDFLADMRTACKGRAIFRVLRTIFAS